MFSVGHLAFGYLSGKASSKLLNESVNIPLLFLVSILPDVDALVPGLKHRGPTHSLIVLCTLSLPFLLWYRKRAVAYFIALIQHSLLGDALTSGGVQMLWPMTQMRYGWEIKITSLTNIFFEWIFFLICLTIMVKTKDAWTLFHSHPSNLLLSIPALAILLSIFLRFIPPLLVLPHLTFLALFSLSVLMDLKTCLERS